MATPYKPHFSSFKPSNATRPSAGNNGARTNAHSNGDEGPRINDEIRAPQVRLVGDNIENPGIYPLSAAKAMADEQGLDLVEISAKADPPVCKILDYQKYVYQQKKKAKEMKANASKVVIKEIRFGPNTDEHDFQFKLAHARGFLQEGAKVKATIFFRGRSIMFKDQGEKQLLRFAVELEEYGRTEHMPVLEGKRMNIMIAPIKKK
ncbi:MAG: translation initiation factor IF-3 [Bacteroidales bacterium]|nr:translation initiation factor IF-3 [Bacteroidales bacterium]MBQ9888270.1 translation initiation factor IF-3 [Bacteroidales bacterium]